MKVRGISLRFKMILTSVALIAFIIGLFGVLSDRYITQDIEEDLTYLKEVRRSAMRTEGHDTTKYIAITSTYPFAEGDSSALKHLLAPIIEDDKKRENSWILFSLITDDTGQVVAYMGNQKFEDPLKTFEVKEFSELKRGEVSILERDYKDQQVLQFVAPIIDRYDTFYGYSVFLYNLKPLETELIRLEQRNQKMSENISDRLLYLAGLAIILGMVIAIMQSLQITKPLKVLSRTAQRIAEGELTIRARVSTGGEIGQLTEDFNTMADKVESLLVETAEKATLEKEMEVAKLIQDTLVPPPGLIDRGFVQFAGYFKSASICGGDFWNFFEMDEGHILLVVGDVTGHGVSSALLTASAKSSLDTLRNVNRGRMGLTFMMEQLNHTIFEAGRRKLVMTFFAVSIDPQRQLLSFANAGHNFPIMARKTDESVKLNMLVARGNRLGDVLDSRYMEHRIKYEPGDHLLLYTDGLTEYPDKDGKPFGERRLRRLLKKTHGWSPDQIVEELISELKKVVGEAPQLDDITLVAVRFPETNPT